MVETLVDSTGAADNLEQMSCAAYNGLLNGDVAPLAAYLRAGHPLEPDLAFMVADMLEGSDCGYRIRLAATRPGYQGFEDSARRHDHKINIGVFMEGELRRLPRGSYESVIKDVWDNYGVGRSVAAEALSYVRNYMKQAETAPGFDHFASLQLFYSGPSR